MTALAEYAKLESVGRYFDGESAQPIEVIVSFGERSLVMMGYNDVAIAHWPLASLRAISLPKDSAAQLVPSAGSDERLIISDREMLRAIRKVCPNLYRRQVDRKGVKRARRPARRARARRRPSRSRRRGPCARRSTTPG